MTQLKYLILGLVLCITAGPAEAGPEIYTVDQTHSAALFKVEHFGISLVAGRFTDISGTIVGHRDDPNKSSVEIVIRTASVNTDLEKRDKHLRNADFLDVEKFPVMSFKSTRVKKLNDNVGEVTGLFSLHGVTKTITTTVTFLGETDVPWGQHRAGCETSFVIKRTDYGMDKLIGPAGDRIQITLLIEAMRIDPPHSSEHPTGEHPTGEQPTGEQPKVEDTKAKKPDAEHPGSEHPTSEHPSSDHPSSDHPK